MPWTDKPSGGPNNPGPWGRPNGNNGGGNNGGGGGGGNGPRRGPTSPDLEELLRSGRERFGRGRGGGAGGGGGVTAPSGPVFGLVIAGIIALWLFSGIYQVKPGERGVVTTFGNFTGLTGPGLNWHVPWPIQNAEKVDVVADREVRIGGNSSRVSMLTSDLNIVDVNMTVNYEVKPDETWDGGDETLPNAAKYLFNIEEPSVTVRAAAEAALREVVGANEFEPIVSRGRALVNQRTAEILQNTLDSYDSGVNIIRVNFGTASPPERVVPAQRDVIDANSQAERQVNVAQGIANRQIPVAQGEARQIVLDAEAYAARVVAEANGDAARFNAIYDEYAKAPEVTRQRMYLETMERVLGDMNKVVIDDDAGGTLPYLNLNELAREAQQNRPRRTSGSSQPQQRQPGGQE
ncbi:FtsH protease activity modulator HflK [Parvularcula maris]|uniref:Protein HflK n=1 Tax=Parvularcula maris TaxID=2965077 RepID=A0A9X2L7U9_9PROT|nr:FtsH protease activity modulator HflK [Parvularcula maris]MCQ8184686.1 FtsH protease activity modulator HflK [Parvularcula maris]